MCNMMTFLYGRIYDALLAFKSEVLGGIIDNYVGVPTIVVLEGLVPEASSCLRHRCAPPSVYSVNLPSPSSSLLLPPCASP